MSHPKHRKRRLTKTRRTAQQQRRMHKEDEVGKEVENIAAEIDNEASNEAPDNCTALANTKLEHSSENLHTSITGIVQQTAPRGGGAHLPDTQHEVDPMVTTNAVVRTEDEPAPHTVAVATHNKRRRSNMEKQSCDNIDHNNKSRMECKSETKIESRAGGTKSRAGGTKSRAGGTKSRAGGTKSRTGGTKSRTGGTKSRTGGTKSRTGGAKSDAKCAVGMKSRSGKDMSGNGSRLVEDNGEGSGGASKFSVPTMSSVETAKLVYDAKEKIWIDTRLLKDGDSSGVNTILNRHKRSGSRARRIAAHNRALAALWDDKRDDYCLSSDCSELGHEYHHNRSIGSRGSYLSRVYHWNADDEHPVRNPRGWPVESGGWGVTAGGDFSRVHEVWTQTSDISNHDSHRSKSRLTRRPRKCGASTGHSTASLRSMSHSVSTSTSSETHLLSQSSSSKSQHRQARKNKRSVPKHKRLPTKRKRVAVYTTTDTSSSSTGSDTDTSGSGTKSSTSDKESDIGTCSNRCRRCGVVDFKSLRSLEDFKLYFEELTKYAFDVTDDYSNKDCVDTRIPVKTDTHQKQREQRWKIVERLVFGYTSLRSAADPQQNTKLHTGNDVEVMSRDTPVQCPKVKPLNHRRQQRSSKQPRTGTGTGTGKRNCTVAGNDVKNENRDTEDSGGEPPRIEYDVSDELDGKVEKNVSVHTAGNRDLSIGKGVKVAGVHIQSGVDKRVDTCTKSISKSKRTISRKTVEVTADSESTKKCLDKNNSSNEKGDGEESTPAAGGSTVLDGGQGRATTSSSSNSSGTTVTVSADCIEQVKGKNRVPQESSSRSSSSSSVSVNRDDKRDYNEVFGPSTTTSSSSNQEGNLIAIKADDSWELKMARSSSFSWEGSATYRRRKARYKEKRTNVEPLMTVQGLRLRRRDREAAVRRGGSDYAASDAGSEPVSFHQRKRLMGHSRDKALRRLLSDVFTLLLPKQKSIEVERANSAVANWYRALKRLTSGYDDEAYDNLLGYAERHIQPVVRSGDRTVFKRDISDIIIIRDIPFVSLSPSNTLPYRGVCSLGYVPMKKTVTHDFATRFVRHHAFRIQCVDELASRLVEQLAVFLETSSVAAVVTVDRDDSPIFLGCGGEESVENLKSGPRSSNHVAMKFRGNFRTRGIEQLEFLSYVNAHVASTVLPAARRVG